MFMIYFQSIYVYTHNLYYHSFTAELMVQFSESTFSGLESSGSVSVTLLLGRGISASIISVNVTAFDQTPVSAQGT